MFTGSRVVWNGSFVSLRHFRVVGARAILIVVDEGTDLVLGSITFFCRSGPTATVSNKTKQNEIE